MNKTKIPWCDYTINPIKGLCPMACSYCYARRMYKRFKWNPEIRYEPQVMYNLAKLPDNSKVFWGSTIELFHDAIPRYALDQIFEACSIQDNLIHIFLTKQPQNVIRYMVGNVSYHHYRKANKFPNNIWLGTSITNHLDAPKARDLLLEKMAKVNFLSIEPLLGHLDGWALANIIPLADWIILGSKTQPVKHPNKSWVDDIITKADKGNIPIFVKEPLASYYNIQRQEYPMRGV